MKQIGLALSVAACLALAAGPAWTADSTKAAEKPAVEPKVESKFHYVGETKCKTCHKAQYESWTATKHAKAWTALKPEEQKKAECMGCHMTGKTEADSMLVNVACEACHGPGSEYRKMNVMKDAKLAAANGLLPITEATCTRCHNKTAPTFKGFDFTKAKDPAMMGVHKHAEKKG